MKIGIDITTLAYQGFGVTNYTYNLVKNLLVTDKKNNYHLFYSSFNYSKNSFYLDEFRKLGATVHEYKIPLPILQILWGKLNIFPVEWLIGKMDVFYFSDFLRAPLLKGTQGVTTVHDLVWKIYPQFHESWIIKVHTEKMKRSIEFRDKILVDSQSTKNDLKKYFPEINKNLIHVLYPGIGEEFNLIDTKKTVGETYRKYSPFLLYVGANEPRKNLDKAIVVFSELINDKDYDKYKFLIAGKAGWKNEKVFRLIKQLKLDDKVIFTGFVKDNDLPGLYKAANLTVYLSAYEGFGLPPLESLACGTKIIAGDNSSMKETINKEFLVDVNDNKKILEKMKYLLTSKETVNKTAIMEKFSWKNSAKEFLKIIDLK